MRVLAVPVAFGLVACMATAEDAAEEGHPAQVIDTVLARQGTETISLQAEGGTNRLVWTSTLRPGSPRWVSRPLLGAVPSIELGDVNGDQQPDLFWTIMHEEFIGGQLLLAQGDSTQSAFVSAGDELCRVPELGDVTGDDIPDIRTFQPYAVPAAECYGDAYAEDCVTSYPTEWVRVLVLRDGQFIEDQLASRGFYRTMADEYADAAGRLEGAIRSGSAPSRCDMGVVRSLRELSDRARGM